jgi:long-chain acyl-CoA synthetase
MEHKQENILLLLEDRTKTLDKKVALGISSPYGWSELSFQGLGSLSKKLACYLINSGVDKGDRISILSESIPEWGAGLFASVLSGAITVPIDIKLTEQEIVSILNASKPKILLISKNFFNLGLKLKNEIDSIENIIVLNGGGSVTEYPCLYNLPDYDKNMRWRHRGLNTTAFIIYTSGTTGTPKGIETTFKNVVSQIKALEKCFDLGIEDKFLSILPMNHLFELTVGFLNFLCKGSSIYYSQSLKPKDVFYVMQEKQITFMIVVPAFLKLIKSSIQSEIKQKSKMAQKWFEFKYNLAKFIPSITIRRLMFKDIHKNFGGKFKGFISGGAPLDINIAKFFERVGLVIYEVYGLSETSPIVSLNCKGHTKLGSVGRPIPGVSVKIDSQTSELLVKGDNVMKGYYKRPDLTVEVIDKDGWFHTGDKARIDKDGYVYITGRIKNMIVLDGGKKVFPEDLEAVFEKCPKFADVCVFGAKLQGGQKDGTEDIFVAVLPSEDLKNKFDNEKDLEKEIKQEIKILSQQVSSYKRPKNVLIAKQAFPRTATSKIKRREVKAMFFAD